MTTEIDDIINREKNFPFANAEQGLTKGFVDPSNQYPKANYSGRSSINESARGENTNNLSIKNGIPGKGLGYQPVHNYDYGKVQVDESLCGHVYEVNDTPGGERILLRHTCGAGVDIQPDGTIVINATGNRVDVVNGEHTMTIEGDGTVWYSGNLNMTVTGDYNLNVKGDYNINVGGKKVLDIVGSFTKSVGGVMREYIKKSKASTVLKESTNILLGNVTNAIKGSLSNIVDGTADYSHKGSTTFSSEIDLAVSSPNVNMTADDMTCIGDTGTFGGENVITYSKNIFVNETTITKNLHITNNAKADGKFIGHLAGNATGARNAVTAGTAALATTSAQSAVPSGTFKTETRFSVNIDETLLPTATEIQKILSESRFGVRKCSVDADGGITNSIDLSIPTGGVTNKDLTISGVRSKLKNSNNLANSKFVLRQVSKGVLSPTYTDPAPTSLGRMVNKNENTTSGSRDIGPHGRESRITRSLHSEASEKDKHHQFIPDPLFNPSNLKVIDSNTKLSNNTSISKFASAAGDPSTIAHIIKLEDRRALARNLLPHSRVIDFFQGLDQFNGYSLHVAEGIYQPGPSETIESGSITDLKQTGRAIVYELISVTRGEVALSKTYDLAVYLKDNIQYDKMSLYYDKLDPAGLAHHAQIAISVPAIPSNYKAFFKMDLETLWNNNVLSSTDLVEVPQDENQKMADSMNIVDAYGEDYTSS